MAEMKSPNAHARENRNDTPRKRKTHIIKVRVTAEEKLRIAYACKELHLTQSELVRRVRYNYKDHAGKPCKGWETFKTKAEAQERKITVEKELLDGTFLVPDTMTVEEMLYKWIPIQSSKHKWSPKTYTQSVAMVQNLIVPYGTHDCWSVGTA